MKKKIFVFIIMFIMVFIPGIFLLTGCGETQKPYIISIEKTMTDGLEDTYTITYSDETTSFFVVTNGKDGIQGIKGESGKDGHTPIITIGPGLVGRCNQQGNIITNSYSDVSIMSETYRNNTTGGLIGSLNGGQVSYCYSVGEINAISTTQKVSVGGLIGNNVVTESITQIDNCFAIGNINITAESDDNAVFGGLIVSGPTTTNSFTSAEQNIIINNSKTEDKNSNYEIISKQEIIDYCRNNWDSNIWNLNKISGLPDLY